MAWFWQQQQEHRHEEPRPGQCCGMRRKGMYPHQADALGRKGFPTSLDNVWQQSHTLSSLLFCWRCSTSEKQSQVVWAGLAGRCQGWSPVGQPIQLCPRAWKHQWLLQTWLLRGRLTTLSCFYWKVQFYALNVKLIAGKYRNKRHCECFHRWNCCFLAGLQHHKKLTVCWHDWNSQSWDRIPQHI